MSKPRDGNRRNNFPGNIVVHVSQSAHMKEAHGWGRPKGGDASAGARQPL